MFTGPTCRPKKKVQVKLKRSLFENNQPPTNRNQQVPAVVLSVQLEGAEVTETSGVAQPSVVDMDPILGVALLVELEPGDAQVEAQQVQHLPVKGQVLRKENG